MPCEYSDLKVSPDYLEFEVDESWGYVLPNKSFKIEKKTSDMTPSWDVSTSDDWIKVNQESGRGEGTIRVTVDHRELEKGEHDGFISIDTHVNVTPSIIDVKLIIKGEEPTPEPTPTPPPDPEPTPEPTPTPTPPTPEPEENWIIKILKWILEILHRDGN